MAGRRTVRVTRSLPPSARATDPPLKLRPREAVTVLERSEEWPAFVLVQTRSGARGWVPARCLGDERPRTHAHRAFDTTSLDPAVGEALTILEEDPTSGWAWCRDADGNVGWYPLDRVDDL